MAQNAEVSGSNCNFENPLFREIHKNMWLKKVSPATSKKKREKLWVVFCIHDDTNAFLETYLDSKLAVFHKPEWYVSLNDVQHISPTICAHEQEYEFVLTLSNDVVRLAAPTWDQMHDWVESLRGKLHELRILSPKENIYTKLPDRNVPLLPTRDPTSPLPPPPPVPPEVLPGIEPLSSNDSSNNSNSRSSYGTPRLPRRRTESENQPPNSAPIQVSDSNPSHENDVFNFDNFSRVLSDSSSNSTNSNNSNNSNTSNNSNNSTPATHYEFLFQNPGPSNRNVNNLRLDRPTSGRQLERSASCSPRILQPPPQPYKTLREQQVMQLQKEMKHPTGVRIQLRRKDCISSIGFVDAFDSVWICGWKQKEHPMLYNALHIGDQLISIEGFSIKSSVEAHKILQSHYCGLFVNIVIKRVPHGKVFVIHREVEGQPLGIIQENNTAVIETVQADSLAARHGLPAKALTCDGLSFTNWVLTEINGRPLNLFFKKNQVKDRLNSVGKDISILVQPLDLIKMLKKQMKNLKNYKDYILQ